MTALYRSKKGEVGDKEHWLKWADDFWAKLGSHWDQNLARIKKPEDREELWQRTYKVLQLEEVTGENNE